MDICSEGLNMGPELHPQSTTGPPTPLRIAVVGRFRPWPWGQHPDEAYLAQGLEAVGATVVRVDQEIRDLQVPTVDWVLFTSHVGSRRHLVGQMHRCRTILWTLDWIPDFPDRLCIVDAAREATLFVSSDRFDWEAEFGIHHHVYLPGACEFQESRFVPRPHFSCAFLGSLYNDRRRMIAEIVRSLGGQVRSHNGVWLYGHRLARFAQRTKVMVGDNARNDVPGYWSTRNYVIPGAGGFLLTPHVPGLEEQFQLGIHLAVYQDLHELRDTLRIWITRDREREEIRRAGLIHVRTHHTWRIRARSLLSVLTGTLRGLGPTCS